MLRIGLFLIMALVPVVTGGTNRHTVAMTQFQFTPRVLRVSAGDTVVWENHDIVPHTATANPRAWDTGDIPAKGRYVMIVRVKGEHTYTCLYHSNMTGKLIVE